MKLKLLIGLLVACCALPVQAADLLDTLRAAQQQDPLFVAAGAVYQAAKAKQSQGQVQNGAVDARSDWQRALAQQQFKLAQQDLVLRVAHAYFDVLGAEDRLWLAEQRVEIARLTHDLEADTHDNLINAQYALLLKQRVLQEMTRTPLEKLRPPGAGLILFQEPGGLAALMDSAARNSAQIAAASIAQDLAGSTHTSNELETIRHAVAEQVRQSYLGVDRSIGQIQTLRNTLKTKQGWLELNPIKAATDARAHAAALNAQQQLFTTQYALLQAQYVYLLNHLHLKMAMGSLERADLAVVNGMLY